MNTILTTPRQTHIISSINLQCQTLERRPPATSLTSLLLSYVELVIVLVYLAFCT